MIKVVVLSVPGAFTDCSIREGTILFVGFTIVIIGKYAEQMNSNDVKIHEEAAAEIWTFSVIDDISAGNQDSRNRKFIFYLPFPARCLF